MEKYLKYALLSLILVSLFAKFIFVFLNQGLWWDEAVYLGLGENILKGYYSLNPDKPVETFRPPLFPLLISAISSDILVTRIIVVLISIFSVAAVYLLSKELFGKEVALWTSLFLSANHLFIFFSTKTLTEPLFISLISISLLFLLRGEKPAHSLISGIFAGLAFLTRYLGTILIASCFLYFLFLFLRRKGMKKIAKEFTSFLAGVLVVLFPWLLLSYNYYGNIFGAYFTNLVEYSGSPASSLFEHFNGILEIFGLQIAFVGLGFYVVTKQMKQKVEASKLLLLAVFLLPIIFVLLSFHVEPRYLLSYLPVYAIFFGIALKREFKYIGKILKPIALVLCFFSVLLGFLMAWNDRLAASGLVEGSLYLRGITNEKDVVMSESYPYIYYLSERKAIKFPLNPEDVMEVVKNNHIKYVLLYKFESGNPAYTTNYFENNTNFERVKSFEQWGDPEAVIIYKVV